MTTRDSLWTIDAAHSELRFTVSHLVIARVSGRFARWSGTVWLAHPDLRRSVVDIAIEAASIDTGNPERDAHLRSPDFLDTEIFPMIRVRSIDVVPAGDEDCLVNGELTIRGVSRPVTIVVSDQGRIRDEHGRQRAAFSAHASFNRRQFGILWHQTADAGTAIVGDQVEVHVEAEAVASVADEERLTPEESSSPAAAARAAILEQHGTLRTLLWAASTIAENALVGRPEALASLRRYAAQVASSLRDHLTFEERLLVPLLEGDPPLGPIRARRLTEEHVRQRAELAELECSAEMSAKVAAARLRRVAADLLADMENEEQTLLTPDVVRDDAVVVDQSTG
jgi:polyisoprenoid-binding protein YceI